MLSDKTANIRRHRRLLWPGLILLMVAIIGVVLYPVMSVERSCRSAKDSCIYNQRLIALEVLVYTQDHDQMFPASWEHLNLSSKLLECRAKGSASAPYCGYGLNAHIAGQPIGKIAKQPTKALLTADSMTPMSLVSSPADIEKRHQGGYVAAFADGHAEYLQQDVPLEITPVSARPPAANRARDYGVR